MNVFDVIIIGFGKGGKTLAAEFAKRGQKVAIIERSEKMYGGTCINCSLMFSIVCKSPGNALILFRSLWLI